MIRTGFVALSLGLYTLILGPPLILYTLVTRSAEVMYSGDFWQEISL